jgi:hypothetical protein
MSQTIFAFRLSYKSLFSDPVVCFAWHPSFQDVFRGAWSKPQKQHIEAEKTLSRCPQGHEMPV